MAELPADSVAIIEVSGELDMHSAEALRVAARREVQRGVGAVIVDLSGCPFYDSTGMSVMLELSGELAERDVPLLIVIPPEPVARRRLVTITGLELALVIFDSQPEALSSLTVDDVPAPVVRRRVLRL